MRIVVAANPEPFAAPLERKQRREIVTREIRGGIAAMEAVAERNDPHRTPPDAAAAG